MDKYLLNKEQIRALVGKNSYPLNSEKKFLSRCIDGRYKNLADLPALAFPGADLGELALIAATGQNYGFEINIAKSFEVIVEVVGGAKNFSMHTDHHGDPQKKATGCGHWKQINLDPAAYGLDKKITDDIQKLIDGPQLKKTDMAVLEGDHLEGAVLMVKGAWGIWPRYKIALDSGSYEAQVFIYHQSLVDERHRLLAKGLLETKAVKLFDGCDENYLYQVLSEMAENHLMETAKRLAKGLPIFSVVFDADGGFKIEETGVV